MADSRPGCLGVFFTSRIPGASRVLGLDIGSSAIKMVYIENSGGQPTIAACGLEGIRSGESESDSLSRFVSRMAGGPRRAVVALAGPQVISRHITMPYMTDDELKSALPAEIEKYVPFDVKETVSGGVRTENLEPEMRVFLGAAKRSLADDRTRVLKAAGFRASRFTLEGPALATAYLLDKEAQRNGEHVAIVDVGSTRTSVVIVRDEVLRFCREIKVGGDDFTAALARAAKIGEEEAETLKRDPGTPGDVVRKACGEVIDNLCDEVMMSLDYVKASLKVQVEQILLTGGAAITTGLTSDLEARTNKPVRIWTPLLAVPAHPRSGASSGPDDMGLRGAVALGLAAPSGGRLELR